MKRLSAIATLSALSSVLFLCACSKNNAPAESATSESEVSAEVTPLAEPTETTEEYFVEGVAGGVMISTAEIEAEVVSVDQEKREAVVRGPAGNEVTVKVGEGAVNFYQVQPGDRVHVKMARELVIYVPDDVGESEEDAVEDGAAVAAGGAEKGDSPAGAVVATTQVTSTIKEIDQDARTATLTFEDGEEETFDVRPDVDMTNYEVGQKVVFLVTEMLAMDVQKL